MRTRQTIFCALALLAAAGRLPAGESFSIQDENPVSRLYGLPPGGAVSPDAAGLRMRVALDVANNTYARIHGADVLVLDGETWVTRLDLQHTWRNGWHAALQVPVVSHQRGGGTDDFIEWYHDRMGLPQGNRKLRPSGLLEYRYNRGAERMFTLNDPTTGIGDVRVSAGAPLWRNQAATRAVDAVAGVEVPTGDPDRLLGSGSTDFSLGLAVCDLASLGKWNLELHGSAGVLVLTEGEVLEDFQRNFAGAGNLSLGWRLAAWLVPRLQLDWHSPVFENTGLAPLDDWAVELVSGVTVRLPADFALDLALAEDLAVADAPDVVFHVCVKRSL